MAGRSAPSSLSLAAHPDTMAKPKHGRKLTDRVRYGIEDFWRSRIRLSAALAGAKLSGSGARAGGRHVIARATLKRYIARSVLYCDPRRLHALRGSLIFMIDFVELLRQAGKYGRASAGMLVWMTLLRLPAYTEILLAFAVLVGTIGALLMLNRKSELAVMRGAGMSVWQFLAPGLYVAIGPRALFRCVSYSTRSAAAARTEAERLFSVVFGKEIEFFFATRAPDIGCVRMDQTGPRCSMPLAVANRGSDAQPVYSAAIRPRGPVYRADRRRPGQSARRVLARRGRNGPRASAREPEQYASYLVSTYLTPERVQDALGTA